MKVPYSQRSKTTLIEYQMVENLTMMSFDLFCSESARLWCDFRR